MSAGRSQVVLPISLASCSRTFSECEGDGARAVDSAEDLLAFLQACGKLGSPLTDQQKRRAQRFAEIGRMDGCRRCEAFVATDPGVLTLQYFSLDGTPIRVRQRQQIDGPAKKGGYRHRVGGRTEELLMVVGGIRRRRAGELQTVLSLYEPQPLTEGKKADAIFAAARLVFRSLREQGFCGITIEVKCCDRAAFRKISHLFEQWHFPRTFSGTSIAAPTWRDSTICASGCCLLHACSTTRTTLLSGRFSAAACPPIW